MKWLAALLLLVSCGAPDWKGSGTVLSKNYEAAHDEYVAGYTTYVCMRTDPRTGTCTYNAPIITPGHTEHYDPDWTLKVKGDTAKHTVSVPESVWNSCSVNDSFSTNTQRCTSQ